MVKDRAVERFGRRGKPPCDRQIILGRLWAVASMGEHDPRAMVSGGIGEDLGNWDDRCSSALVRREMEAPRMVVDVRHPQSVAARIGFCQASGKKSASGIEPV